MGHNVSYAWISIWNSNTIVQNGYKWSIGSSSSIPPWEKIWLGDGTSPSGPNVLHKSIKAYCF